MSPDEFALMQAIRANPPDNTPRLVYADFLEERGDESSVARAEFIRVQCSGTNPERAEALLAEYRERWDERLREELLTKYPQVRFGSDILGWNYRRGLVSTLEVDAHSINALPNLPQFVGPIDHLVVHVDDDTLAPFDVNWRGWSLNQLKILDYRSNEMSIGLLYDSVRSIGLSFRQAHSGVPILRLATQAPFFDFREITSCVNQIFHGELNPVLLVEIQRLPQNASHLCIDPLGIWALVHGWAESIFLDEWRVLPLHLMPHQLARVTSAKLPHLVRYYQLAGLPPPAEVDGTPYPQEEREHPKRGIVSRATRWLRRGG